MSSTDSMERTVDSPGFPECPRTSLEAWPEEPASGASLLPPEFRPVDANATWDMVPAPGSDPAGCWDPVTGRRVRGAKLPAMYIRPLAGEDAQIHRAVRAADMAAVRDLVAAGEPLEVINHYGYTPLLMAVRARSRKIAEVLLDHGAAPDRTGPFGWTALHWAARLGDAEMAALLVQHRADVASQSTVAATPLHQAAGQGRLDIAQMLLAVDGRLVRDRDVCGETALDWAVTAGHLGMARLLIEAGAEVNGRDGVGRTPLHRAAELGHRAIVRLLLESGAHPLAPDAYGCRPFDSVEWLDATEANRLTEEAIARGVPTSVAALRAIDSCERREVPVLGEGAAMSRPRPNVCSEQATSRRTTDREVTGGDSR